MILNTNKFYFVYAHINKINNKAYIGITLQTKAKYRWGKNGEHYKNQIKFYNAIKKYGWDNFEHIILEENIPGDLIVQYEKDYIAKYDSYLNGYNATPGGEHQYYYQKICKKVYQCSLLDNSIINEFFSIADAARWVETNLNATGSHKRIAASISEICNNKYNNRKSYFNYNWCFVEDYENLPLYKTSRGDKRVLQYDLDGNFIREWLSASEAQKTLKINNVSNVCNGKRKKAGGYIWKYKENK